MRTKSPAVELLIRDAIDQSADYAVFLIAGDETVQSWNRAAELMYGYSAAEIIGQPAAILFTPEDREDGAPERELAGARSAGRAGDIRWHLRKDGSRFFSDGVMSALRNADGTIHAFCKIQSDITERYRAELRLAAQLTLTHLLDENRPPEEMACSVLQAIATHVGWDVGILWRPTDDGRMRAVAMWADPALDGPPVRALKPDEPLPPGAGLPGAVLATKEAAWVRDIAARPDFPGGAAVRAAGLASAVAFPILYEGNVTGVMEFFNRTMREPDQALLPVMALVGAQLGAFIEGYRTNRELRESEERYRVVSEAAQDAIFTIDEKSAIVFCNAAVERLFGWKPEELLGKPLDVIVPSEYRAAHRAGIERYLRTGERRISWTGVELEGLHRDGHRIPLEISFGVRSGDGPTLFTGFAHDITERKRALEQERQAREEAEAARMQLERRADEESSFRHLASALAGAVEMTEVLYEITSRATLVTRADGVYIERITGPGQAVEVVWSSGRGVPARGLRVPYPGSMTDEILRLNQPVILADMSAIGVAIAPYLSESCARCEVLVTPLVTEEEPLGALVLLNSGLSGRTFHDGDILRARTLGDLTSLALRRVRLMEQEREAREKAEAAVRVRDETLGIVSHDLRNPLTKIALSVDLIDAAPAPEQRELIETIRSAARQARRLIDDLLDVARVESGRFSVRKTSFDPEALVRSACESHEALAAEKGLQMTCEITQPLPKICADRDRIVQVFGNLIGNAIKFTPEGGGVAVESWSEGEEVFFRVSDTGAGIPEADLRHVFRPYWQAKKTAHMGAGLGLAIVRGIVEAHGGRVWAENASGSGAQFTFTIPVAGGV